MKTTQESIFKELLKQIKKKHKKFNSSTEFFMKVRPRLSRIELMILDSAYKNMPLDNLHKTLILKQNRYLEMIQNVTQIIKDL